MMKPLATSKMNHSKRCIGSVFALCLVSPSAWAATVLENSAALTSNNAAPATAEWAGCSVSNTNIAVYFNTATVSSANAASTAGSVCVESSQYDYSDAPITGDGNYGSAGHLVTSQLMIGTAVTSEVAVYDSMNARGDSGDDGVTFKTVGDGTSTKFSLIANVTGTNTTGKTAMLCGYLDGAADGVKDWTFQRSVSYQAGRVGLDDPVVVGTGNEELCIQVPAFDVSAAVSLAGDSNPASAKCTGGSTFNCTLTWTPDYLDDTTVYARFRLTTDPEFFSNNSPSPTGLAIDGEVEDYQLNIVPTSATIGSVGLEGMDPYGFLAILGTDAMTDAELLALLQRWDPDAAASLVNTSRDELIQALLAYLDPDGDGRVAVLRWNTLEERGTIGFFAERSNEEQGNDWTRVSRDMLPGLIDAPLGSDYMLGDPTAVTGIPYFYRLIEQEAWGTQRSYGPYLLMMEH